MVLQDFVVLAIGVVDERPKDFQEDAFCSSIRNNESADFRAVVERPVSG